MPQITYQSRLLLVLYPWPKAILNTTFASPIKANQNLTAPQKELLCWHFRLGHRDMLATQHLLRGGHLGNDPVKLLAGKCALPKCDSCQFGKQKRKSANPKLTPLSLSPLSPTLKTNILHPGQRVFVDNFVCSSPGRLFTGFGKNKQREMYAGGCLFVDAASKYVHVEMHVGLNSHETLAGKTKFERLLSDMGVGVQEYVSNNSTIFSSSAFAENLLSFCQTSHFAGVGAHHQNGVAERGIQTIMSMARTVMLHATIRWGSVHSSILWPMAVNYVVWVYNHTPNPKTGLAPIDLMSKTTWPQRKLKDTHVWGCPIYALDPKIADGKKIPRWNTRSRQGIFVGFSRDYASNIPLILILTSGKISPLFHVVFDDWFATVAAPVNALPDSAWDDLFCGSRFQFVFDNDDPVTLPPDWTDSAEELYALRRDQVDEAVANNPVAPVDPASPAPRRYVPLPSARSSFTHPPPPINRSPHPHFSATPRLLASSPTFYPSSTSSSPTFDAIPRNILDSPTFRDQLFPPIPSLDLPPESAPLVAACSPSPRRSDRLHPPSPAPAPRRSTRGPKPWDFLYLAFVSAFVADAFPTQVATYLPLFDPVTRLQGHIPASFQPHLATHRDRFWTPLAFYPKPNQNPNLIPTLSNIMKPCKHQIAPTSRQR